VGARNHALDGSPDSLQKGALLRKTCAGYCNVPTHDCIAHWSLRGDKTAMRPVAELLLTHVIITTTCFCHCGVLTADVAMDTGGGG